MLTCNGELKDWLFYQSQVRLLSTLVTNCCCCWDLTKMTLACEYLNSKLVDLVCFVDVLAVLTTFWSRFWRWILIFPKRSYFGERLYLPVRCVFGHVLFFWPSSGLEGFRLNIPSSPILSIFPNAMAHTWKIFYFSLFSFFKHLWRENLCCMLSFTKLL